MKINELQDGQTVTARWGRAWPHKWNLCPWQQAKIVVARNDSGVVAVGLADIDFAEFGLDDFSNGAFYCEDYCLEIKGLEK